MNSPLTKQELESLIRYVQDMAEWMRGTTTLTLTRQQADYIATCLKLVKELREDK